MGDDMRPCDLSPSRQCNCPPDRDCPVGELAGVVELPFCQPVTPLERLAQYNESDQSQAENLVAMLDGALREGLMQSTVALEAQDAVYGDRQDDYGHPREDFTRTAVIWTGLLHHKLAEGAHIEADDIARCMIGVKLARDVHSPKRDNRVDMAGYAITLDRLETGR